jgi:hypothetical protein
LFSLVRKENPNFAEKIVAVGGELTEANLGLTEEDFEMLLNEYVDRFAYIYYIHLFLICIYVYIGIVF